MRGRGKSRGTSERYVLLRHWLIDSPAWKSLPAGARALYIELTRRYNGSNNGRIPYSVREAVQALGVSRGQAKYLFDMLLDRGFVMYTSKGAFSLKTERNATEWLLTEYASDHPPAHATKQFMRWNGDFESVSQFRERKGERRPKMTDADRERARRPQNKTRFTAMNRTVHSHEPHGSQQKTVKAKKRQNGSQQKTVNAENDPSTVHSNGHLYLPGSAGPSVVSAASVQSGQSGQSSPSCQSGQRPAIRAAAAETIPPWDDLPARKPWSTPILTEISFEDLPEELRLQALCQPVRGREHEEATAYW